MEIRGMREYTFDYDSDESSSSSSVRNAIPNSYFGTKHRYLSLNVDEIYNGYPLATLINSLCERKETNLKVCSLPPNPLRVENGFIHGQGLDKFIQIMGRVLRVDCGKILGTLFLEHGSERLQSNIFDLSSAKAERKAQ